MGGRGHGPPDIPKHHLTADDFPHWNEDDFLAFVPPSGDAPEGRPRATYAEVSQWVSRVTRFITAFALILGQEHKQPMLAAVPFESSHA